MLILPVAYFLSLSSATSQKTTFFIVTAVKASNLTRKYSVLELNFRSRPNSEQKDDDTTCVTVQSKEN
jgi:hypothetical protein